MASLCRINVDLTLSRLEVNEAIRCEPRTVRSGEKSTEVNPISVHIDPRNHKRSLVEFDFSLLIIQGEPREENGLALKKREHQVPFSRSIVEVHCFCSGHTTTTPFFCIYSSEEQPAHTGSGFLITSIANSTLFVNKNLIL